jgi:hypothetical protein
MTGLGATLYFGFFGLAALWLFVTSDRFRAQDAPDQDQQPDLSNSASVSAGPLGSRPWLASHSSQK